MPEATKAADDDFFDIVKAKIKGFKFNTQNVVLLSTIVLWIILGIVSKNNMFLSSRNIQNLFKQMSIFGVIGVSAMLVILTSGIDLSIGSVIAVINLSMAGLIAQNFAGLPTPVALLIVIALGAFMGLINGALVFELNLPPFIATLGMMIIWRGVANVSMEPPKKFDFPSEFGDTIVSPFLGLPILFWILIAVVVVTEIILRRTSFGRYVYALGSNPEAARLSGVNTRLVTYGVYSLAGLIAAIGGFMLTARTTNALSSAAEGYELNAISAAVLGGASLMGGEGSAWGAFVGALMIGTIYNGCQIMGIPSNYTRIIVGALLIITVAVDQIRKRKTGAR